MAAVRALRPRWDVRLKKSTVLQRIDIAGHGQSFLYGRERYRPVPKVSREKDAVSYFGLNGLRHFLALTEFERRLAEFDPPAFFVRVTYLSER